MWKYVLVNFPPYETEVRSADENRKVFETHETKSYAEMQLLEDGLWAVFLHLEGHLNTPTHSQLL